MAALPTEACADITSSETYNPNIRCSVYTGTGPVKPYSTPPSRGTLAGARRPNVGFLGLACSIIMWQGGHTRVPWTYTLTPPNTRIDTLCVSSALAGSGYDMHARAITPHDDHLLLRKPIKPSRSLIMTHRTPAAPPPLSRARHPLATAAYRYRSTHRMNVITKPRARQRERRPLPVAARSRPAARSRHLRLRVRSTVPAPAR